jgi:uncharacterized protein YktA (UPF0223 family)
MFYEVRVFTPKGDLKKVISERNLSKIHWSTFKKIQPAKLESLVLLREYKKQINIADYHGSSGS